MKLTHRILMWLGIMYPSEPNRQNEPEVPVVEEPVKKKRGRPKKVK